MRTTMGQGNVETTWLTTASALVLVATVGVVVILQGLTRHRTVSTMAGHVVVGGAATILGFVFVGFGVGFGPGGGLIGNDWYGLAGVDLSARPAETLPTNGATALWHGTVAVLVSAVVASSIAERATTTAHLVAGLAVGGVVYPMAARAVWVDGLVAELSVGSTTFIDAGGSSTIGLVGGWGALVGTMIIGPRLGRFGPTGQPRMIPGRSSPVASTGALVLLVGWIGVAGGPNGADVDIATRAMGSLIGAAGAAVVAAGYSRVRSGSARSVSIVRGVIGGLVASSAGIGVLDAWALALIGAVGGLVVESIASMIERRQVDDPLGAFPAFGTAGAWGIVAVGLFDWSARQLLVQLMGGLIVAAWAITISGFVFGGLQAAGLLRVSDDEEIVGLEVVEQRRIDRP